MRITFVALLALVMFTRAEQQANPEQDLKQLEGTWRVASLEIEGKLQPKEKTPKEIVIAGKKLTGIGPDMMMTLDSTKKPKWVDLTFKKGDKQYPVRAIYELDGDELQLCLPMAPVGKTFANRRPENFDTTGQGIALFKAKRTPK